MSRSKLLSHPREEGAQAEMVSLGELEPGGVAAWPGLWMEVPLPKCEASLSSLLLTSQQPTPPGRRQLEGPPGCREGQRVEPQGC